MENSEEAIYPEENTLDYLTLRALELFDSKDLLIKVGAINGDLISVYHPFLAAEDAISKAKQEYNLSTAQLMSLLIEQCGYSPQDVGGLLPNPSLKGYASFEAYFEDISECILELRMREMDSSLEEKEDKKEEILEAYTKNAKKAIQ